MAGFDPPPSRSVAPVASVWCRQVDNEAESPGYTTIPDDFPGLRETLESIRVVGNLTINIADTHDYWDPGPSQSLSFYPNLFLYPAAGHRYTCVGRMFLSTEDRPRLGMKTLVFSTADLLASGDFGGMVLRAHATMDGRGEIRRLTAEPDPAVYQAVGDGFLFGKGTTDPVVIVASDQWDAAAQTVLELVGAMPAALVALGAFLVFPYFLPAPKVNLPELAEHLPTALALMRVARGEAAGDRHEKRMKSWEDLAVTLRDLTKPTSGKKGDTLPLVLQYVRDHEDEKVREIARRVDVVELPRLGTHLADGDRQAGRDHRKEMWRIGAAMETAALLLSKPKGRSVPMSGEAARRANEYLQARPGAAVATTLAPGTATPGSATPAAVPGAIQHPAWLRPPPQVAVASSGAGVPVPTGDDPSLIASLSPAVPVPPAGPSETPSMVRDGTRPVPGPGGPPAPSVDLGAIDARVQAALRDQEAKLTLTLEDRLRQTADAHRHTLETAQAELTQRLTALETRPALDPAAVWKEVDERVRSTVEGNSVELRKEIDARLQAAVDGTSAELRKETDARLKAALDGSSAELREQTDARLKAAVDGTSAELRREIDARLKAAVDGSSTDLRKETDTRLKAAVDGSSTDLRREIDARLKTAVDGSSTDLRKEIDARLKAAVEGSAAELRKEIDARVKAAVEGRSADLQGAAARAAGEAWSSRFTTELQSSIEQFDARAAKSEEELRAALVAQLDVELTETKEQGSALREEIEARVRKIIEERSAEMSQRAVREIHDLEQRLSVLVEGRSKDLETRLVATGTAQRDKVAAVVDERVARVEQRVALEREARLGEVTEAQTEALAGLQVRMQSFVEGKLREGVEKEREQYLALLARLKLDTEQSLARTVDAAHLDTLLNERLTDILERAHADQSKAVASAVTHSEGRIREAQQELLTRIHHLETSVPTQAVDVGHIERTVRRELDDFDRRLKVVHDHILPMVRQTWLKVSQQEFGGSIRDLRQSLEKEIQRVEASLVAENDQLRERLETAVAQHGRIWLNLIQQLSREEGAISLPPRGRGRGVHRAARPLPPPPPPASDGSFPPEATAPYGHPATGGETRTAADVAEPPERRRLRRPAP